MSLLESIESARAFLERNGRVSLRVLRREFELDDRALEELIDELVEIQRVAVREGQALAWAGAPSPTAEVSGQERAPRDYTPRHLAEKILRSRSALEGERKHVTVLFADVKGSTALAEQADVEAWHNILDRFFAILTEGVHRFEGTVNQYTGDGIMALFGAPIAHEDHAQRACHAALHLRQALRGCADQVRLEQGLNLSTRMGLNSGEVVVGKIGDDLRMDYTAQGQVVNVAQRMEQLAEPGHVFLAERTAELVAGYFRLRELGPTRVEGLSEPVQVHELQEVGEFQSRFDVSRARGLSRFVGREQEMARLEAALARALRGRGQLVGIVAGAGTGKSRLVHEFVERCRGRGHAVFSASCTPYGRSVPMGFHLAATRSFFGVRDEADRETARNQVAGRMVRADPALASDIPFMLDFLGLAEPGAEGPATEAEVRQREYLRIGERMLGQSDFGVFVAEDLHWTDAASDPVRVQISRIDLPNPRLKVFTYRPEYRPAEADWPEYEEIRLKPLSAESTGELVRDLLGPKAIGRGLEQLIQEPAGGNPFFVEEIVQSLADSGQLEGTRGSYRLARAIGEIEVPGSVQAVLAARIDRLDDQAKRALQEAAVIGVEFSIPLLEGVTTIPRRDLGAVLHALCGGDFVYQQTAYPEVEYAFKHPLTQQVAYETQLGEARRRVHGRVARCLEERHEGRLDEQAALIAHHWGEADEPLAAARWHGRAARWLASHDVAEALRHWRRARSCLGEVPTSPETAELGTVACTQILNLGWRQGMSEAEAARVFAEGRELALRGGSSKAHAILLDSFATQRGLVGHVEDFVTYNRQALELAGALDDPSLALGLDCNQVYGLFLVGRLREALAVAEESRRRLLDLGLEQVRSPQGFHILSNLTLQLGIHRVWTGQFRESLASLEEALELASRHRDPDTVCFAHHWLAECHGVLGDREAALSHGREAVEIADRHGSRYSGIWALLGLGRALTASDKGREAAESLERALATARDQRTSLHAEAVLLSSLAEAHLQVGELARAGDEAREAIALAERLGTPLWECDAQLALARVLLRSEGARAARRIAASLDRALRLADESGARSREPRIHEVRGDLAAARADPKAREKSLREAQRLFAELGASGHAERIARETEDAGG